MRTLFNNERGGMTALLSVIVLSLIMVSTLTSFYTYLENRARFQERIRVNYQMGYVVEDMGRVLVEARERFVNDPTCTTEPNQVRRWVDCTQVCATAISALTADGSTVPAGTPTHALCVKNDNLNKVLNNADHFCTYNVDGNNGQDLPAYCSALVANNDSDLGIGATTMFAVNSSETNKTKVSNWYSRLDKFFDTTIVKNAPVIAGKMYPILETKLQPPTLFGWIMPDTAVAQTYPPTDPPPTGHPPTQGAPIASADECSSNPELSSCAAQCAAASPNAKPAFCKSAEAKVQVSLVGGNGCTAASTDPRCKRCAGTERRNGNCLKLSICPPWVDSRECVTQGAGGGASDKRLHQMLKLNEPNLQTYMWGAGDWGACSAGTRTRTVSCVETGTGTVVAPVNCGATAPPSTTRTPCFGGGGGCSNTVCNVTMSQCYWMDCP